MPEREPSRDRAPERKRFRCEKCRQVGEAVLYDHPTASYLCDHCWFGIDPARVRRAE